MPISFQQQVAAIGTDLVRSWDFSDMNVDFGNDLWGQNVGGFLNSDQTNPVKPTVDLNDKPSGCTGSLKYTIPSLSSAAASWQWYMNFSNDLSVKFQTEGDVFYVLFWQKFDSFFMTHDYTGGGGWKQAIIGEGDNTGCTTSSTTNCKSSCTDAEVVLQNTLHRGFPQMYHNCGSFTPFEEPFGGSDFKLQNAMPSPFCLYSTSGTNYPGCFHYAANEWMQFQIRIELGPRVGSVWEDSNVQTWAARLNAQEVQLFDYTLDLSGSDFGKLWLLPYNSGKDDTEVHQESYTWYAGAIVSRSYIPMFSSRRVFFVA